MVIPTYTKIRDQSFLLVNFHEFQVKRILIGSFLNFSNATNQIVQSQKLQSKSYLSLHHTHRASKNKKSLDPLNQKEKMKRFEILISLYIVAVATQVSGSAMMGLLRKNSAAINTVYRKINEKAPFVNNHAQKVLNRVMPAAQVPQVEITAQQPEQLNEIPPPPEQQSAQEIYNPQNVNYAQPPPQSGPVEPVQVYVQSPPTQAYVQSPQNYNQPPPQTQAYGPPPQGYSPPQTYAPPPPQVYGQQPQGYAQPPVQSQIYGQPPQIPQNYSQAPSPQV